MATAYWRKRAESDMDAVQDAADVRIARIGQAAKRAADDLAADVEQIIGRYAQRFGLTREEAEQALKEPFDEDSRAYGYRRSRAEALREATQKRADELARAELREVKAQRAFTAGESYLRAVDQMQARGIPIGFATPDTDGLLKAIGTRWTGESYSSRIWRDREELARTLEKEVTASYLSGKSDARIAQEISSRFGVGFRKAERLVRTETSYVCNRAEIEAFRAEGIERYEFLTAKDSRTCKLCMGMNGQTFAVADAEAGVNLPPMHPWCRCTVLAVVEGEKSALDGLTDEQMAQWGKDGAPENVGAWLKKKRRDGILDWSKAEFTPEKPLEWHWGKHFHEFAEGTTKEEYLQAARNLLSAPLHEGEVEELTRSDGSISRYSFVLNEFVASTDTFQIRTFFRPVEKEAYWKYEHERNE